MKERLRGNLRRACTFPSGNKDTSALTPAKVATRGLPPCPARASALSLGTTADADLEEGVGAFG